MSEEAPDYLCDLLFMDSSYLPMLTLEVQLKGTFIMFMFLLLIVAITKKALSVCGLNIWNIIT